MQSLRQIRHVWSLRIVLASPKSRASSRTEINILAPSQYLILHFVHEWDQKPFNKSNLMLKIKTQKDFSGWKMELQQQMMRTI